MRGLGSCGVDWYRGGERVLGLLDRLFQTRVLRLHQKCDQRDAGAGRFGRRRSNARGHIDTVEIGERVSAATTFAIVATFAAVATYTFTATT